MTDLNGPSTMRERPSHPLQTVLKMREPVKKLLQLPRLFSGRTEMDLFSPRRDLTKVERERYTRKRDFFASFQGTYYTLLSRTTTGVNKGKSLLQTNRKNIQGDGKKGGTDESNDGTGETGWNEIWDGI